MGITLRKLLAPLVRLLLARGITQPFLANLLKSVYVQVAEKEFPVPGRGQSNSRISLLTGVHRKDVQRIRAESPTEEVAPPIVSLGTQLIATWIGDERYLDPSGSPKPLKRRATADGSVDFEQLVASVSRKDIRARVVLDELLRLGVAEVDHEDFVRLNVEAFVPDTGFDEKVFYFGQNLRDHISAGTHNLLGEQPPFLERSVFYHGLRTVDLQEIVATSHSLGTEALKELNRKAMKMKRISEGQTGANKRFTFGVYFFSSDDELENEESSSVS